MRLLVCADLITDKITVALEIDPVPAKTLNTTYSGWWGTGFS